MEIVVKLYSRAVWPQKQGELVEDGVAEVASPELVRPWDEIGVMLGGRSYPKLKAIVFLVEDGVVHAQYGRYPYDRLSWVPQPKVKLIRRIIAHFES